MKRLFVGLLSLLIVLFGACGGPAMKTVPTSDSDVAESSSADGETSAPSADEGSNQSSASSTESSPRFCA